MRSRTRVLILCLLCVVCASKVLSKEITEFDERTLVRDRDLSRNLTRESDGADRPDVSKLRDKRALGLLLSGLAQIFGYTVTPIQFASLENPNTTSATSNSTANKQLTASSRLTSTNNTAPRQQETVRFTGVVNFGNNSDIIGHLQRYEQIFHGRGNNTTTMTTTRPTTSMPKPTENLSIDLRANSPIKPPLLAPFFVKIPLPIAPDLIPITPPIENLKSYPPPLVTFTSEFNEDEVPKTPVRKEQETVYRNNKNTEQYTVEDKEIYDETDVMKPANKQIHQLFVDEPTLSKQQDERYNEVQRKEKEYLAKIKQQQTQRDRNQGNYEREEEIKENHRNREDEITNRNRDHASQYSSGERRPAYDDEEDEESPERYEEHANQANRSNEDSEQQTEEEESEKTEHYQDYDDNGESSKQSGEYKQDDHQPAPVDFEKYAEVTYNHRLPIGDYFHENNPQQIRDSYGEVLDKKKLQDDRLSGYFSMFKQPYVDEYDYQQAQDTEDTSQGDKRKEKNGYDEHLKRVQKLRDEYALPVPESKYEEYDINDEKEANRNDRQEHQNHTVAKSKKPKAESDRGKENVRVKTTSESSRNQLQREPGGIKPQDELDLMKYTPLIVPIRYIDAGDRVEEASMRQLKYEKSGKKSNNNQVPTVNNVDLANKEKSVSRIANLPERTRQLAEGEHKEFQLWPPPFDYVFDNTVRTNTILPANPHNYPLNYYQNAIKNIADNTNNDNSSDQPAGYLVVVGDSVHPNQYPNDVYYFPKETINPRQKPHLSAENMQRQLNILQHNTDQRSAQVNPNPIKYDSNETSTSPRVYYYEPQEAPTDVFNRYGYAFEEYIPKSEELPKVDARNQISNTENWSNKIYPLQPRNDEVVDQPRPILAQLQNIVSSTQNVQSVTSEKRYPQSSRRRKSSRPEDQDDGKPKTSARHSVPRKPFHDPQSAHDFFNFSKNDYSFNGESVSASKVAEENGKNIKKSRVSVVPEPIAYHRDESTVKYTIEPENDTEKAVVREYRNKVATLRVSEQRRSRPNGPIHYVNFTRNI